ncbi:MAG: peptide deformylase [Nitrospiraceae bacterium]|nr:peptide deformylase [Nitrospiraceae bacterium]MDA8326538.1 peptide deformylase [Nitrospiraceae bacterium]
MVLKIRTYPDPVLRGKAKEVTNIDGALQRLIDNMIETMYAAPGVGLAANQVGILQQILVIDINPRQQTEYPLIALLNPRVVTAEGSAEGEEGCLSLPGFNAVVERAERVFVKGVDREGKETEIEATGLLAVALQHEIDHLRGRTILDKASPLKRSLYKKRALKKSAAE